MAIRYQFSERSMKRMEGVNPDLVTCALNALAESKYDFTIPWMGGVRTAMEQHVIWKDKKSKCDGYEVLSYHQLEAANNGYGNALDVVPVDGLYANRRHSNYFARLMLIEWQELIYTEGVEGVMIWGGTFGETGWDPWHFEIRL